MKSTMHMVNGKTWFYYRARICDELGFDLQALVWFLSDANREHVGYWVKKQDMLEFMVENSKGMKRSQ